ncbi:MAG: response regulator transcription factor [Anaerolineales bacterium]
MALFVESFALMQKSGAPLGIASGLTGFAALAQHRGKLVRAAHLFGAAEAMCAATGERLAPIAQAEYVRNTTALRSQLDEAAFVEAWAEGRAMTREGAVAYALAAALEPEATPLELDEPLTARELEILRLIADGLSNKEIAHKLVMSVGTIKWYTGEIYGKLQVRCRTQAVARAREWGLLS